MISVLIMFSQFYGIQDMLNTCLEILKRKLLSFETGQELM